MLLIFLKYCSNVNLLSDKQLAKAGSCPAVYEIKGTCLVDCHYDSDCNEEEKCCFNGCGMSCTAPSSRSNFPGIFFFLIVATLLNENKITIHFFFIIIVKKCE